MNTIKKINLTEDLVDRIIWDNRSKLFWSNGSLIGRDDLLKSFSLQVDDSGFFSLKYLYTDFHIGNIENPYIKYSDITTPVNLYAYFMTIKVMEPAVFKRMIHSMGKSEWDRLARSATNTEHDKDEQVIRYTLPEFPDLLEITTHDGHADARKVVTQRIRVGEHFIYTYPKMSDLTVKQNEKIRKSQVIATDKPITYFDILLVLGKLQGNYKQRRKLERIKEWSGGKM